MLKIIADADIIARCQRQLINSFKPFSGKKLQVRLGHPGASFPARIRWYEDLGIWIHSSKTAQSRYWNAFGVIQGGDAGPLSITCEINFPFCGIDRRIGGALARDRDGRIFVVHRGRIGGGRRGIGKSFFEEHYRGAWTLMEDGDSNTSVALVGALKSPRFARQVAQFVRKIDGIKRNAVFSSQTEIFNEITLREELLGAPPETLKKELASLCDRDLVLVDLSNRLIDLGFRTGNDGRRDLFALDRSGRLAALFTVGTDLSEEVIHKGVARLMLGGGDSTDNPSLFFILPALPETAVEEQLKRLRIGILTYQWSVGRACFPGIETLLDLPR
ncbi:MAG: hypothetical protein JW950_11580 [Deltaproteobacteria bacterium]|nr:hypothetical protein [Deltaproteobacteria bacterium]